VSKPEQPIVFFATPAELETWFDEHGEQSDGIWLKFAKKAAGTKSVVYAEALDVALCHGWIDGQVKRFDDNYYLQRFTPRRKRSNWSKINRGHVERLVAEGRMRPGGLREVERAKADGRWDEAYDSSTTATVPDDFAEALAARPAALDYFESLGNTKRYSFLYRIRDAKRPETRARRIAEYVELLARGETLS
jgi:uncharacterized protein YdeI (YjbR/CyaY-like superfamily)